MLTKVLFPVLMNEQTEQMISCMSGLAKNGVQEVLLLHVLSVSEIASGTVSKKLDEDLLRRWKSILEETGLKVTTQIITGIPWIEIVDTAEKGNFSFILIGSHGNTFMDRVLLGSVTEHVVHHSKKPIFVFRLKNNYTIDNAPYCVEVFRKILFATDFSETSNRCIPYIEKMLNQSSQDLLILHVQDLRNLKHAAPEKIDEFNRIDQERLAELKAHFEGKGFKRVMTLLTTGYSISEIINYTNSENPSIIVMGKKGKSNLKEMLLGGVAETIIRKSKVPVFLVENGDR